jgi:segregation and condensation protein A
MLFDRGNVAKELKVIAKANHTEFELQDLDLYKLLKIFEKVVSQYETELARPRHTVVTYPYTVEEQKVYILGQVATLGRVAFEIILGQSETKILAIYNFLAVLELLAIQELSILIGEGYNQFWLMPKSVA